MLTPKERLLRAIRGQEVDRVPFAPFLAYYFEHLPKEEQEKGQLQYMEAMGADPLLRGFINAFHMQSNHCTKTEKTEGGKRFTTITTPSGSLYIEQTYVKDANTWFLTKHPVESTQDLFVLKEYYQDLEVLDNRAAVMAYSDDLGNRGLLLPVIGSEMKSSFQGLLEYWVGTENLVYLCADSPDEVQDTLDAMKRVSRKTAVYATECGIDACISWEDSSTGNISPSMYNHYIAPELSDWNTLLQEQGVTYVQHACGLLKDILVPMSQQGTRCIESLTPYPTGNVTMSEADALLPKSVSIIGGIDPMMMLNANEDELAAYVKEVLPIARNRGLILSNSDSCPPGVDYNKFLLLARLVKEFHL